MALFAPGGLAPIKSNNHHHQFIEEMGEIDLKSKLGEGTDFIGTIPFKIPLADDLVQTIGIQ